jgi:hypothetical protein
MVHFAAGSGVHALGFGRRSGFGFDFAKDHGVPFIQFKKGNRKDDVMAAELQEEQADSITSKSQTQETWSSFGIDIFDPAGKI